MEIKENFLNKINSCIWLENCGLMYQNTYDFDIVLARNLDEAIANISSINWENKCLEKIGNLTAHLSKHYAIEYNAYWNKQIKIIKKEYLPTILARVNTALDKKKWFKEILNDINFNLLNIFMSNFYSEYYSDDFFEHLLKIYLSGHLPCGWIDDNLNGKIIIY